ncbi:MAG: YciI family protein [Rhodopila sp.]|nr:YciI family protein [Rhodopila sp.]
MLFAVIRHDKPNSLDLRLSERPKHLEYLKTVLDKIMYGGALLDDDGKQVGSVLMIDVADKAAAEAFADADPFVDAGLFASTAIRGFRPVFKDGDWL